jgi:glutamine amidotransferase
MKELKNLDLIEATVNAIKKGKPYLGICLGLQVLFSESEEFGKCRGLDIFRGKVVKFEFGVQSQESGLKIPQMGWNVINIRKDNPLYEGIPDKSYFYFVHSYYVLIKATFILSTPIMYRQMRRALSLQQLTTGSSLPLLSGKTIFLLSSFTRRKARTWDCVY